MRSEKIILFLAIILSIITFWNFPFLKNIKLLIVLIHEIFHASTALITGFEVKKIFIHSAEAGSTIIGKNNSIAFFLVVSSGYIGSTLLGGFLLWRGFYKFYSKITLFIVGVILVLFTYFYSTENSLTYNLGLEFGIVFIFISLLSKEISSLTLIFLGCSVSLYSVYDLSDFRYQLMNTDAGILTNWIFVKKELLLGFTKKQVAYSIALVWSLISITGLILLLKKAFTEPDRFKHLNSLQRQFAESNVSPEVAKWFLERGLDLNGKPLSKNWAKEIKKEGNSN